MFEEDKSKYESMIETRNVFKSDAFVYGAPYSIKCFAEDAAIQICKNLDTTGKISDKRVETLMNYGVDTLFIGYNNDFTLAKFITYQLTDDYGIKDGVNLYVDIGEITYGIERLNAGTCERVMIRKIPHEKETY